MSTPDDSPEFAYRCYRTGPNTSTFETLTANGLYVLKDMTPEMFDAFVRDAEAAGPGNLESVLQTWARMSELRDQ